MVIRNIEEKDNAAVGEIIRSVLMEMGAKKIGTTYADPNLDTMYEYYQKPNAVYFVVENEGKIVGGAGIYKLENGDPSICELQKMYFLPEARGLGVGSKMINLCLQKATEFGFKKCYLETMTAMVNAQKLYNKCGFYYIDGPLGSTGHTSCPIWMLKDL